MKLTDLHCHILPGMDDGAKDIETSIQMLHKEKEDGVANIMFTSHFNYERTTVKEFLTKREKAFKTVCDALGEGEKDFTFKLGAEVFFSPGLCELEADKLCMGDTDYMLLEFPTSHKPHFIKETLYNLQAQGITPVIAHVERYGYVMEDLHILYDWISAGAYAQINAGSLLKNSKDAKLLLKLINWDLVHVIGTDAHSMDKRAPKMAKVFGFVEEKLGKKTADALRKNADDIFHNLELDVPEPHMPRKFLGVWR